MNEALIYVPEKNMTEAMCMMSMVKSLPRYLAKGQLGGWWAGGGGGDRSTPRKKW